MVKYRKPSTEAEIRRTLEPVAKIIEEADGIEYKVVQRMAKSVGSNITTLSMYFPVYEENRMVGKRLRTFICMMKK